MAPRGGRTAGVMVSVLNLPLSLDWWAGAVAAILFGGRVRRRHEAFKRRRAARAAADAALTRRDIEALGVDGLDLDSHACALADLPSWMLTPGAERVHWLNGMMEQLWPFYNTALSEIVLARVNELLQGVKSPGVRTMRLEEFTLGKIPVAFGGIALEPPSTAGGSNATFISMMTDFRWAGDPTVALGVRTSAMVKVRARLRQLQVFGRFRIQFGPLQERIPCLGAVRISLLEAPSVDFQLSVAGGEVTALPGVNEAVRHAISSILHKKMIWPQRIVVPLSDAIDPLALQPKIVGMLYVKVVGGRELPRADSLVVFNRAGGGIDPYVVAFVQPDLQMQTDMRTNDRNPKFGKLGGKASDASDVDVWSFPVHEAASQSLTLQLWDADNFSDDHVATAKLGIERLAQEPGTVCRLWLPLTPEEDFKSSKYKGSNAALRVEALYAPFDRYKQCADGSGGDPNGDAPPNGGLVSEKAAGAVLELPADWELPPSGILAVHVRRLRKLPQMFPGGGLASSGPVANPLQLQPRVRITLGSKSYKSHIGQPVAGSNDQYEIDEVYQFVGVDPDITKTLVVDVFQHTRMKIFRRSLGSVRAPLAALVADAAFHGDDGATTSAQQREYPLDNSGPGASIDIKLTFSRSASVAAARKRKSTELARSATYGDSAV